MYCLDTNILFCHPHNKFTEGKIVCIWFYWMKDILDLAHMRANSLSIFKGYDATHFNRRQYKSGWRLILHFGYNILWTEIRKYIHIQANRQTQARSHISQLNNYIMTENGSFFSSQILFWIENRYMRFIMNCM